MKWSQLKRQIEGTFADSIRGRVEVWNTRYRKAHDQEGEAWITIDKKLVYNMATGIYWEEVVQEAERVSGVKKDVSYSDTEEFHRFWDAFHKAEQTVRQRGILTLEDANKALFEYLNMPMDNILSSDNIIIQAFGMLDKRLGKRRLRALDIQGKHPLVKTLYEFRCSAEGIKIQSA